MEHLEIRCGGSKFIYFSFLRIVIKNLKAHQQTDKNNQNNQLLPLSQLRIVGFDSAMSSLYQILHDILPPIQIVKFLEFPHPLFSLENNQFTWKSFTQYASFFFNILTKYICCYDVDNY